MANRASRTIVAQTGPPLREHFRLALKSARPYDALLATGRQLLRDGVDRQALIDELKQFRLDELQDPAHEAEDDAVCDVLDHFHGWVARQWRL